MVLGSLGGSARKSNRLRRALSVVAVSPSRIAQSGYNAQTIVPNRTRSADSAGPLALGVDIGGTAIKAAIVGTSGDFLESFHAPSPRSVSALHDFVHSILKNAKAPEFDRLFLKGMIQHHKGALVMVEELFNTAGSGQDSELFNFATDVDSGQRAEIRIMEKMLGELP